MNCHLTYDDAAQVCAQCGNPLTTVTPQQTDPFDHTAKFDAADISENKVIAMLPYLMSWIGIVIALIAGSASPYASFHVRQALKIQICSVLAGFLAIIPILGWIAMGICAILAVVINLIGFFDVCRGMAREPLIISKFGFLR
jgi:uncharacterized membrane protein